MDSAQLIGMLVGSVFMGVITQIVGDKRGRKYCFFWGFLLGLIGLIIVICLGKKEDSTESKYDNLEKLKRLKEDGAITPEEYEEEKKKLLK